VVPLTPTSRVPQLHDQELAVTWRQKPGMETLAAAPRALRGPRARKLPAQPVGTGKPRRRAACWPSLGTMCSPDAYIE
jgi:hypothetical protein